MPGRFKDYIVAAVKKGTRAARQCTRSSVAGTVPAASGNDGHGDEEKVEEEEDFDPKVKVKEGDVSPWSEGKKRRYKNKAPDGTPIKQEDPAQWR